MANTFTRGGRGIWVEHRRYAVTASNDSNRYYEPFSDTYDSWAKWDDYDSSPTAILYADQLSTYIVPVKAYLKGFNAHGYSNSGDYGFSIEFYYSTSPTYGTSVGNETMTLATVTNGTSSTDTRRTIEKVYEDWGRTILLPAGSIILPTVRSTYDGTNVLYGSMTYYFEEF
jgi:hypothetical protein